MVTPVFAIISLIFLVFPAEPIPVACYYVLNELPIEEFPQSLCTHIILINSAHISEDGRFMTFEQDLEQFSQLSDWKTQLFVTVTSSNPSFSFLTSNYTLMHEFAITVVRTLLKYHLNGVDIDWEFPVWSRDAKWDDRQQFADFLKILKSHLTANNLKLSVAVSGPPTITRKAYDVEALRNYADMVQIMNYDFHVFNKFTNPLVGFNAPLHPMRAEISVLGEMNVEASMKTWFELGLPRNISFFGIPTYVRAYQLLTRYLHKPYSPAIRARPEITKWDDICLYFQSGYYTTVWNQHAEAPYLYGNDGLWISYENEQSVLAKMAFARNIGVAGVMVYSVGSDDVTGKCGSGRNPLLTKIAKLAREYA